MKFILTVLTLFALTAPATAAQRLCDALMHEKTYEHKSSFKKLEAGKGDWIFRDATDYKTNFKVNSALENRFKRLYQALNRHKIQMMIVPLPTRGMMHQDKSLNLQYDHQEAIESYQSLTQKLRQIGFSVSAIDDFSPNQDFYYKADHHWNASGAKTMAQQVAKEIKLIPGFDQIKKENFSTEIDEKIQFQGTFTKFISQVCDVPIFEKDINAYKTFKSETSDDDLFADTATPEIILLGTSNSSPLPSYANFEGALKQAIGADIFNMSVSGGGVETAVLDYFNAGEHIADKPKILIWEIPIYQNFKGGPLYRQLIPAVYGECDGAEIFKKNITLTGKEFSVEIPKGLATKNHYMYLEFSEPKQRKFKIQTKYNALESDEFNLRLSKHSKTLGKHFVEFDQNNEKMVRSIEGKFNKDLTGDLTLSICAYPSSE